MPQRHTIIVASLLLAALATGCATAPATHLPQPLHAASVPARLEASCPSPLALPEPRRTDTDSLTLQVAEWRRLYAQCRDEAFGLNTRPTVAQVWP